MTLNQQWHLASRPLGQPTVDNFRWVESSLPDLLDGQVLIRHHFLSLDPYMRGRMSDAKSYAQPQALDTVMQGGTAGEVLASKNAQFSVGDFVVGMGGWQTHSVVDASVSAGWRKVRTDRVPLSHYLGAVGMPGVTAWYGLVRILAPRPGDTLTVSAASGAVGSAFGALAKARGCRVVGIAGGPEKCSYVTQQLGFDACIDYKQHTDAASLSRALRDACPKGIDGHFENTGGKVLDAVLLRTNAFAKVALCGMIAGYSGEPIPLSNPSLILVNRLKIEGFIVSEHMEDWPAALTELAELVGTGQFKPRETLAHGLKTAPEAFLGLLKGQNFGKQLVKLT